MPTKNGRIGAIAIFTMFLLVAVANISFPVPAETESRDTVSKVVLSELFTKSTCGACQSADGAMDRLADDPNFFSSRISIIEWHMQDTYTNSHHSVRMSYYGGIPSIPRGVFDGLIWKNGGSPMGANSSLNDNMFKTAINSRPATTQVKIDVVRSLTPSGDIGTYNITVSALDTVLNNSLHLRVVLVEDGNNTVGDTKFRYTAKETLNDVPITLQSSGDKVYLNDTFTNTCDKYKIALVVFVQDDSTREVLQSTTSLFPGNNRPQLVVDDLDFSMEEDTTDSHMDLNTIWEDIEGEDLSFSVISLAETSKFFFMKTPDDTVTFTPNENWNGEETFRVIADDTYSKNQKSSKAFTVTVTPTNDPPHVANPISPFSMMEGAVKTHIDLNDVFDDIDGDVLSFTVTGDDALNVTISQNDGAVIIAAPDGVHSIDETLTFTASDGILEVTNDVKITVKHVNHAPEIVTPLEDITMDEDTVDETIDLDDVFYDLDDVDTLVFECSGNNYIDVVIDPVEHDVTLAPQENWHGEEYLTFSVTDNIVDPITDEILVTVNSVNDAPVVVKELEDIIFDEDSVFEIEEPLGEIFFDADLDVLSFNALEVENLDVVIDEDGLVTIKAAANWFGDATLTFTASDGMETIQYAIPLTVSSVNDPIEVISSSPSDTRVVIDEGSTITFGIEVLDPDGDEVYYTWYINGKAQKTEVNTLGYTADFLSAGSYTVTVTCNDGYTEVEREWELKVTNINRKPVVDILSPTADDDIKANRPIELKANISDMDESDTLMITWIVDSQDIEDSNNDTITISLKGGVHKIKVIVSDGKETVTDEVTVKVKKKDKDVPGFEAMLLVISLGVGLVMFRRRQ